MESMMIWMPVAMALLGLAYMVSKEILGNEARCR